jgi:hypothetical protein
VDCRLIKSCRIAKRASLPEYVSEIEDYLQLIQPKKIGACRYIRDLHLCIIFDYGQRGVPAVPAFPALTPLLPTFRVSTTFAKEISGSGPPPIT